MASRNGRPSGFNPKRLATILENVHDRRAGGVIESLPWRDFIDRCDRPGMSFYLAPPYRGAEGSYGKGLFRRDEFAEPAAWPAGEMVRAGSLVPCAGIGPGFAQRRDCGGMTFLRGNMQRGVSFLGPCAGIGSGLERRRDRGGMAFLRGNVQRGNVILGPRVGIGPGPQAGAHILGAGRLEETPTVPVHALGLRPRG